MAIGLVVGHAAARRIPGAVVLDAVAVLAFVTPAALLGVGLVGVWNRPGLQWAAALADRFAVLEEGSLVQQGRLDELTSAPATPFVRVLVADLETRGPVLGPEEQRSEKEAPPVSAEGGVAMGRSRRKP